MLFAVGSENSILFSNPKPVFDVLNAIVNFALCENKTSPTKLEVNNVL